MKFLLFDRNENYVSTLKDVIEAKHIEEINGEDVLELRTLHEDVEKGYRIAYKSNLGNWHEFIIREIEETHTDEGIEKYIFCESSFYETLGDYIEDRRAYNTTAAIALSIALEPTRWEIGQVDDLGISSTNYYNTSSKEAVQKITEAWKGEIRTRVVVSGNKITHRYVDILAQRGNDLGKRFAYTKDIESITKTVHRDDVITALYGYGKGEEVGDGYGRRINFKDLNGGKAYVENNEARLLWGRNNPDGSKSHVFGKVEFDDCEDRSELLQLTIEKLEELSKPLITYEANVIDLKAYGYDHEGTDLGDTVAVIDKEFKPELRLKARVVRIERDLLENENIITLGNFIPSIVDSWNKQEEHINNFRDKQGVWDRSRIIGEDETIHAQYLEGLVSELNDKMNSQGGYVYISDDGKGITTYDRPIDQDPTMAIQILGGSFRIANSKLPNNEWNWRTFGTGDGFLADYIVAGTLDAGIVSVINLIANNIKSGTIEGRYVYFNLDEGILEVVDDIGRQRVVLGNYASGKYGLLLKDPSGNKTILDEDGILQTWQEGRTDNIASNNPLKLSVYIPNNTRTIHQAILRIKREYFRAYSETTSTESTRYTSTSDGGGSSGTSGSGGGSVQTSQSGGAISDNTGSGVNVVWTEPMSWGATDSNENPVNVTPHVHKYRRVHSHEHDLSIGPHTHSVNIPSHTHNVNFPSHSHQFTIPGHNHDINHGIFEYTTLPSNLRLRINGSLRTVAVSGGTYINEDRDDLDITNYLVSGQWNEIEISGTGLGRIDATIFIQALMNVV